MHIVNMVDIYLHKIAAISDPRLQQLSALPSFAAKIRFCDATFKKLKAGSSRIAYDYSTDLVLKLAKNTIGIEQNRTEADGFIQQHYKDIVANVIDTDQDELWIISEKAFKITQSEFRTLTGFDFNNFCSYLRKRLGNGKLDNLKVNDEEKLDNDPRINELLDMSINFQMPAGDMCRISSWGKVKNRAVLIDYGLTNQIFDEYYK
jgi:hypothetical protein